MRDGARVEQQTLRLIGDRPNYVRMGVAGGGNRVTAISIEPLLARIVDKPRTVAADWTNRELGIDGKQRRPVGRILSSALRS